MTNVKHLNHTELENITEYYAGRKKNLRATVLESLVSDVLAVENIHVFSTELLMC
jgi:hypothetical protein